LASWGWLSGWSSFSGFWLVAPAIVATSRRALLHRTSFWGNFRRHLRELSRPTKFLDLLLQLRNSHVILLLFLAALQNGSLTIFMHSLQLLDPLGLL
jgi:hypothetical protein